MTLTLDHIIIYVDDLQSAMQTYRDVGFTVNYGGQHADGKTENGLIIFADGSYIELIALTEGHSYDDAGFKGLLKASGEGYTGFAFQSDDLEGDLGAMSQRGVAVGAIREGGRARPDGEVLRWKTAPIDNSMSPFAIQDITDRDLRVPVTPEHTTHANGATGIHEILIHIPNFTEAVEHFGKMVGTPLLLLGVARFEVGTSSVVLTPQDEGGAMIPYQLSIYTDEEEPRLHILTGARFLFI